MNQHTYIVPKFVNDRLSCATNLACEFRGKSQAAQLIVTKMASGVRIDHGWGSMVMVEFVPGQSSAAAMVQCLRYLSINYAAFQQLVERSAAYHGMMMMSAVPGLIGWNRWRLC